MAKRYESEAVVIIDGEEIPTYARFDVFTDGGLKRWNGALGTTAPDIAFKLVTAQRSVLRMPDGKEFPIIASGRDGADGIGFTGSGPAPI
ncbi:MAG: hypothetical protein HOZ81_04735 [Streptomyces sp.]|nr:hypothetical protein [Streptomyces sp.]